MASHEFFTHTDPELLPVLEELRRREPIFHVPAFETAMAPDYWEVGASGRRYSREFILDFLQQNPPVDAASAGWRSSDQNVRRLGPGTYLFTYTLCQRDRVTRRATIWQAAPDGWRVLYHQGTIVSVDQNDAAPASL
jgi:hypothetical protein